MSETMDAQRRRILEQLFELTGLLGDAMQGELVDHGLTPARAELMWLLHHGGARTQRELSQELRCTPRNVTGLVDALESAGLATRAPHPSDRRATLVELTPQGTEVVAAWETGYETLANQLLDGIRRDELRALRGTLDQVVARLRQATLRVPTDAPRTKE